MTTAGLRSLRGWDARDALLVAGFAVWAASVAAAWYGVVAAPGGDAMARALLFGVPAALAAVAVLGRPSLRSFPVVAGAAWALAIAISLPSLFGHNPKLALAVPAAAVAGVVTHRFRTASLIVIFALTGTYGSVDAFTGLPAVSIADGVLEGLWVGLIGSLVLGRRADGLRPTPALLMLAGFMAVTIIAALTTTPVQDGIRAFRLAPLFLSVVLLLGFGGFRERTLDRVARAMVVVALVVAAYGALRWASGAAPQEEALQRTSLARQYNRLAVTGDVKVQGSLPTGNALGLWLACTIPFLVAVTVAWRGAFRVAAAAALPFAAIALLASGQRAAAAAVVAGTLTVIVVHMLSRGFSGPRLGVAAASVLILIASASVVYPAVLDNPEKRKRYENLLTPGEDTPFQERLTKWRATLDALEGEPFGFGLGAGNPGPVSHRFADIAQRTIDNSYLMIAYDQGLPVMFLFAATMLVLLIELLRHAVWTRGPGAAALSAAAAGTLVAMLVEFMAANYVTTRPTVAGWMIVGLAVAQLTARRDAAAGGAQRPPEP